MAPTTWWGVAGFTAASAVASVILAFILIFLGRLALAPARLYREQFTKAKGLETDIASLRATNENSGDGPNWPVDELFTHIDPEFLSRVADDGDVWNKIGDDIKDQAALGHLRIWGRPMRDDSHSILGQRVTIRLIEPNYWETAHFTYWFLDAEAAYDAHTYLEPGRSGVQYTDLQVNRAEARSLWPR